MCLRRCARYDPQTAGIAADLHAVRGPTEPVLARVDPVLATPILLTDDELRDLLDFVREGLLDPRAEPQQLRRLIPRTVPSGFPVLRFE